MIAIKLIKMKKTFDIFIESIFLDCHFASPFFASVLQLELLFTHHTGVCCGF